MKSRSVISTIMALSLITGQYALAQGNSHHNKGHGNGQGQHSEQDDGYDSDARQPDRGQNPGHDNYYGRHDARGAGPDHSYYAGQRMPDQYRTNYYVVNDWRGHSLSAPPRGYHWVQTGSDYVLVAIATGVILQLLLNN
jgi:Ni/Co efflux regulator RcnB